MKTLNYRTYLDRIYAGWLGKSLGGIIGAPFECHKQFTEISQEKLWPDKLYPNDDLDIQVVWLEALQELGVNPTSEQLARYWQKHCFYVCCEYGVFIDNLENGVYPPLSGKWNNEIFCESEGCPIRSEIWGFIAPNNPQLAMDYASRDGYLDHTRLSTELEMFLSAAASLSFFENDPATLLEKTCEIVPKDNAGRQLFLGVRDMCANIEDTKEIWLRLVRKYGSGDGTKALVNNAFAFLALFRGGNDFKEVMRLCVQFGWDVDCTCATAGALWGALHGSEALPKDWLEKMGKTLICACDIPHKTAKLTGFAAETAAIGLEVAALLNPEISITEAPAIQVRQLEAPALQMSVAYENDTPVLYSNRTTKFTLKLTNPTAAELSGRLQIALPANVLLNCTEVKLALPAGATWELPLEASLAPTATTMASRNLFTAKFIPDDGSAAIEHIFGLHGSECWQYYGPYWDMWDKDYVAECPYQNDKLTCNPGVVPGFSCDAVNCHVRFHHAYLDEKALLQHDLTEEYPQFIEKGGRMFQRQDLTSFDGAACCYLVREFKADKPAKAQLRFYADCPYECYVDGVLLAKVDHHTKMESTYGDPPSFELTGNWQRMVVKLASNLDHFVFNLGIYNQVDTTACAISPYVAYQTRLNYI